MIPIPGNGRRYDSTPNPDYPARAYPENYNPYLLEYHYKDFFTLVNISATAGEGGTVSGGKEYALDATVTLKATANVGYTFDGWYEDGAKIAGAGAVYIFPAKTARILIAKFEAIPITTHAFTVTAGTGGTVSAAGGNYAAGVSISVTATANSGYRFVKWEAEGVKLSSDTDNPITFNMPDNAVTLTAKFETTSTGGGTTVGGVGPLKPSLRDILGNDSQGPTFKDVPETYWAYQYVEYLARKDFVKGKSSTLFAPGDPITRAEFVTILARMDGAELSAYSGPFTDVKAGAYYAGAVDWAVKAGVTKGTSATAFSPDRTISRQEIAAMLARYLSYKAVSLMAYNQTLYFTDEAKIADYAKDYIRNMQTSDIISGYPDGSFKPLANATRAEAAKMLALVHYLINNR
jgi:hypothetical protein